MIAKMIVIFKILFKILMIEKCKELTKCLCCQKLNLINVLDLGNQPLANSYINDTNILEETFPLGLNHCQYCNHLQLTHAVNPDLIFKNYIYVSGTTKTLRDYFDEFVNITANYFEENKKLSILDIACNDGSQLNSFKNKGHETFGIDPAENLYPLSSVNHKIVCDYLTEESISKFDKKFDAITAQNVFAHNTYPKHFLEICKKYLSDDGRIFIQTSQANMIDYGQFDTVYHEHISFFNIKSMSTLIKDTGLYLIDVLKPDIHGVSYVFVISKNPKDDNTKNLIKLETEKTLDVVNKFSSNAKKTVDSLNNEISKYREQGFLIVGYGAAAKGNTVLNFGKTDLDYIVDDNPLKQGLFTPGRKIPIVSFDYLADSEKHILWIPLSWNFFKEIKENIENKRSSLNDKFYQLNFTTL